jgi:hypothetical protein
MTGHLPLWNYTDDAGTVWHVRKAWRDRQPGKYLLEVETAGWPGVRGAQLSQGHFELLPEDDPELPALLTLAPHAGDHPGGGLLHQDLPARQRRRPR